MIKILKLAISLSISFLLIVVKHSKKVLYEILTLCILQHINGFTNLYNFIFYDMEQ